MNLDKKETLLLSLFKKRFEELTFDEQDVYSFLIFVRDHIKGRKKEFKCILDLGDTIAHRHRNQGAAMNCISAAIENNYAQMPNSNAIRGYNGIEYNTWEKEWIILGKDIGICFDTRTIRDISICVLSLLQFSVYNDEKEHYGVIKLMLTGSNQICACTTEGTDKSIFIVFFVVDNVKCFRDSNKPEIENAVIAVREGKNLRLKTDEGDYII